MKRLLLAVLAFFLMAGVACADWLGCDIPDAVEDVTHYAVIIDGAAEVIVPYQENTAADAVLLWDITTIPNASFSVFAINSQGRRSATATPFDLLAKPSGPSAIKIVLP